jgi:dTDP-glucose 4,6-dehydratase/UDP-glucuronate decarboxylase
VSDLVRGLRAMMETPGMAGEVVNLGNPDERSILDLANIITTYCGAEAGLQETVAYFASYETVPG